MADPEITALRAEVKRLSASTDNTDNALFTSNIRHDYLVARLRSLAGLVWGLAFFTIFTFGVAIYALVN